jgi:addiction module HigA family antidote
MTKEPMEYTVSGEMHQPPHPGEVLWLLHIEPSGLSVTEAAKRLGVDRKTLSRILHGRTALTVEMALRLGKALGTSAKVWLGMQQSYDLWQATRQNRVDLSSIQSLREPSAPA